jgi:hypothetical protein
VSLAVDEQPAAVGTGAAPDRWPVGLAQQLRRAAGDGEQGQVERDRQRCSFGVRGDILRDEELSRTLTTYPDGSIHLQEVIGPLVFRFTNTSTGRSVIRNLDGTGLFDRGADGTSFALFLVKGHMGAGLGPNDPGGPALLYFTGTGHTVVQAADGSRTIIYGKGPVENVCKTLAG